MWSGAAKTQAFGGCSVWATARSHVMSFCRTSEAPVPADEASPRGCSGLDFHSPSQGLLCAALLPGCGRQGQALSEFVICWVPGKWLQWCAQHTGLPYREFLPQETAQQYPKGPFLLQEAPDENNWSSARHSQVPQSQAQLCMEQGVSSDWLNLRVGSETRVRQQVSPSARKKNERRT